MTQHGGRRTEVVIRFRLPTPGIFSQISPPPTLFSLCLMSRRFVYYKMTLDFDVLSLALTVAASVRCSGGVGFNPHHVMLIISRV